ncbi:uncharacterized protein CEXT_535331 [Caerostris extrusa]|uniref:Golgi integral membrane protein 4 n=1 Tax=Caerostris extrusa TaxID=172846 RepID=A0AAV4MZI0_CAEEX|nr:uncharacterized protein CEXT_535331 [Caerostris extrusa]
MGEQNSTPSSNPVFIVIMRNSRGKLFVYVAVLGVLCFIGFLLSNTHTSLKELEGINEKCQQQRDSLSAQLQANEKQVSEIENKFQIEKDEKEKLITQISQLKTSYTELEEDKAQSENALQTQLKHVQSQKEAETDKLKTHISELLSEKDKLETSNNAYVWKLEQHASELKLCHLQYEQVKSEFQTCQEQLKMHNMNTVDHFPPHAAFREKAVNIAPNGSPLPHQQKPLDLPPHPALFGGNPQAVQGTLGHLGKEDKDKINETASPPLLEKVSLLAKPHIMPGNLLGDGVLPKPGDLKPVFNNELDAAVEVSDFKKSVKPLLLGENMPNNIEDNHINNDKKTNLLLQPKDAENHPQVAPPNFENVEDKDDHAAERGEDGNQYANPDAKPQVEEPVLGRLNIPRKEPLPVPVQENNDIGVQMQQMNDMMNKSPGDVNNAAEQNVLGMPPNLGPQEQKHHEFKNGAAFLHRGADAHRVMDDKNYEEDDDDRENDDEPPNGLAPAMKGVNNILPDNDFDDQENQDNNDNAKEEEGVVVAPK